MKDLRFWRMWVPSSFFGVGWCGAVLKAVKNAVEHANFLPEVAVTVLPNLNISFNSRLYARHVAVAPRQALNRKAS